MLSFVFRETSPASGHLCIIPAAQNVSSIRRLRGKFYRRKVTPATCPTPVLFPKSVAAFDSNACWRASAAECSGAVARRLAEVGGAEALLAALRALAQAGHQHQTTAALYGILNKVGRKGESVARYGVDVFSPELGLCRTVALVGRHWALMCLINIEKEDIPHAPHID